MIGSTATSSVRRRGPGPRDWAGHPVRLAFLLFALATLVGQVCAKDRKVDIALRRADQLSTQGRTEEALEAFQSLHRQYPRRPDILFRLEGALTKAGRYEDARDLMQNHLKRAPGDITAHLRLGDSLFALGNRSEAFQHWNRLLQGAAHDAPYALAAERYRRHNLYEEATEIYRRGREALGNPDLFAREMAQLAESRSRFAEAVSEYLVYLGQKPQYLGLIQSRVKEFAQLTDDHGTLLGLLADEARSKPGNAVRLRLLTEYALAAGRPDSALAVLREMPGITALSRGLIVRLGAESLKADRFPTARDAYRLLVQRDSLGAGASGHQLGLANAHRGLGEFDAAMHLYRQIVGRAPASAAAAEARIRLARLLQTVQSDEDAALKEYMSLARTRRRTVWRDRALFEVAEIHLRRNEIDRAVAACKAVSSRAHDETASDEANFRAAEYHFLAGQFQDARRTLDRALAGSAKRFFLNDVLELSLLVEAGEKEDPAVLQAFANASKLTRQGQPGAALEAFTLFLSSHPGSALAGRAARNRIDLLIGAGRFTQAIQACRALLSASGDRLFCPWAQLALGRIQEDALAQLYDARTAYQAVLVDYPESLEADAARDRLRRLAPRIDALESGRKEPG